MNNIKKIISALILSAIVMALAAGCGTKRGYTGDGSQESTENESINVGEASESLTSESTAPTAEITEPETEFKGKYWPVRSEDGEGTVDWVKVRSYNGVHIEYDGKDVVVPWAIQASGTGEGSSFYVQDVTGDGYEDLIGAISIREHHPFFVYDLKNGKDLSPYYSSGSLYNGLFTKEEYASEIEAAINPLLEEGGYSPIDLANGDYLGYSGADRGEEDFFENGVLTYSYYFYTYVEAEWICTVEYDFNGGDCKMRIVEANTRENKYKNMLDAEGEHVLAGRVEHKGFDYPVYFEGEDISIVADMRGGHSGADYTVEYKGKSYDTGWGFDYMADKLYFELYDCDGDGKDELVYHVVKDGEDDRQVYDFEE